MMDNKINYFNPLSHFGNCKFYFFDPLNQRTEILKALKGNSGFYCWFNKVNGKFYIGSATNFNNRINDYFQDYYFKAKKDLVIVRALSSYGYANFALLILDITDINNVLIREQFYLDELQPEYNILSKAGNSAGYKHSPEVIEKLKKIERSHTLETRKAMSEARKGENAAFFGKSHTPETIAKLKELAQNRIKDPNPGYTVTVLDLQTNETKTYKSMRDTARALDTHLSTLYRREERKETRPFRGRYIININKPLI